MTKKFGIIGNPIDHSLSPILHNYWFQKYKIDANYSILNVKENELSSIVEKIKDKSLSGINITLPYKQKIVPYLDILVNDAEITSSVNTLYLKEQNTVVGEIIEWKELKNEIKSFDIIINATSLGLKNNEDFDFNFDPVKKNLIFIDTIYNPLETKTLKYLKSKDIKVFNGLEMFIYQGQKAFYLWNKVNPEIDQKLLELLLSKLK